MYTNYLNQRAPIGPIDLSKIVKRALARKYHKMTQQLTNDTSLNNTIGRQQTDNSEEIDLGRLLGTLLDNKWFIVAATLAAFCCGVFFCSSGDTNL